MIGATVGGGSTGLPVAYADVMSRSGGVAPTPPSDCGPAWYRGDCHVHSAISSGADLTPKQLAVEARQAGLDFVAVTEHDSADTHTTWAALSDDKLLVILGQEATTPLGHWLALGLKQGQVVHGQPAVGLVQVHAVGGLGVVAHPHAPYPTGTFGWPIDGFDLVEVWNGLWASDRPWNADNEVALADWADSLPADLRHGRWRPAIGNSDTHLSGQIDVPHTGVLPEVSHISLTHRGGADEQAIVEGLRAGRSWISESAEVDLTFTCFAGSRRAGIGDRLDSAGGSVVVRGVPSGQIGVHTDRGEVHGTVLPSDGTGILEWRTTMQDAAFVRLEVRHAEGSMAALTNPIVLV